MFHYDLCFLYIKNYKRYISSNSVSKPCHNIFLFKSKKRMIIFFLLKKVRKNEKKIEKIFFKKRQNFISKS